MAAGVLADGIDLDDVGVVEPAPRSALLAENLSTWRGVLGEVFAEDLEGDEAVERFFVGLVDDAHAAAAELGDDSVVADAIHHLDSLLRLRVRSRVD